MKTYNKLYEKITSWENLVLAWQKARKGKTNRLYVIEFEKEVEMNLIDLQEELKFKTYFPKHLQTFILRDPKTRVISKSDFRDRIVHHAIVNILEPIFDKGFIYDSCANRKGKGNLFALKRFNFFLNKVTKNKTTRAYCLKADIKHYFQEVDKEILYDLIKRKIYDHKVLDLIKQVINTNSKTQRERERELSKKGMPLGNLTSQFFANIYLNELDYFVKHKLKAKYYVRYVDDFIILHNSEKQLESWKEQINNFLKKELKLELHKQKSKVILLSKGVDFVGFRNFYHHKLLRRRNIRKIYHKIKQFEKNEMNYSFMMEIFQDWNAYAKWGNTLKIRRKVAKEIHKIKQTKISKILKELKDKSLTILL